jgi:spermidine/putrescine transport system permease protein/putrescine transport system permease protein
MAAWICVFFIAPLILLVLMSFWTVDNFQLIARYNLANWHDFFTVPFFWVGYLRTFVYATVTSIVATGLAFPFGYALAFKASARMRRLGLSLLITTFFTSYLVRVYSWQIILANDGLINAILPYFGLGPTPLLNTPFGTLIGYLTYVFPLTTVLLVTAFGKVDGTLIEAAHNLGVGRIGILVRVIIPASISGIIFAAAFAFIFSFGDFVSPYLLGGGNPPTLSILVIDTVKSASNWPGAATVALTMVSTLMLVTLVSVRFALHRRNQTS